MMKAWLVTILVLLLLVVAYSIDLFELFSSGIMQWIAFGVFILSLVAAKMILGSPFKRDEEDDKNGE